MTETISDSLDEIKKTFQELGFSSDQAKKMIEVRQQRTDTSKPFLRTDIKKRFQEFRDIFYAYQVPDSVIYPLLSQGLLFSQLPQPFQTVLDYVKSKKIKPELFLKKLIQASYGFAVLTQSPQKTQNNVEEMAQAFQKYGIDQKKWLEMGMSRPSLLKMTPNYLLNNFNEMVIFLKQNGYSDENWISAIKRRPDILEKKPQSLIQNIQKMSVFLAPLNISQQEWVGAVLKQPQLGYQDIQKTQNAISFYINLLDNNVFSFINKPDADRTYLLKYLLTSPQSLCTSEENLNLRLQYAQMLNETTPTGATSAIIYRTKKFILNALNSATR